MSQQIQDALSFIIGGVVIQIVNLLINWRKSKSEVKSLDANATEALGRAYNQLCESQRERLDMVNKRMDELEQTLMRRDKESHERDLRIDELEQQLANREYVITQQKERLTALEAENAEQRTMLAKLTRKVEELQAELEEWKTGKKRKTGPLANGGNNG